MKLKRSLDIFKPAAVVFCIALTFVIDEPSAFGLLSIPVLLAMVILWPHFTLCASRKLL